MAFPFDGQYETFQHYGTNAERLAFVPNPSTATGVQPIYKWFATDTGLEWTYDTSWHQINSPGGAVPATVQGDILYASGTNTLAALAKNATATRYLSNTGTTNNPAWAQVGLTDGVTGILPVANGGSGSASGAAMLSASVTLTNAQIKALAHPTPVQLVATPGAGFRLKPVSISIIYSFVNATYTNVNTTFSALQVSYGSVAAASALIINDSTLTLPMTFMTKLFAGAVHEGVIDLPIPYTTIDASWYTGQVDVDRSYSIGNTALMLAVDNNGSSDFTSGHVDNYMKVIVYYTIEALAP